MNRILFFLTALMFHHFVTAQNGDHREITFLARYHLLYSKDSANKQAKSIDSFYLEMNAAGSVFYSILNQLGYNQALYFIRNNTPMDEVMRTRIAGYSTAETEVINYKYNTGYYEISEKVGSKCYISTDSAGTPAWTLHKDKMEVLGQNCQKATTRFRGRHYTAWFCSDLPFSSGPWRFTGLPGLILKIYDDQSNFEFECVSLSNVIKTPPVFNDYADKRSIGFKKLKQLKKLKLTDFDAFTRMEYPGVTITRSDGRAVSLGSNKPYNPLDLTE